MDVARGIGLEGDGLHPRKLARGLRTRKQYIAHVLANAPIACSIVPACREPRTTDRARLRALLKSLGQRVRALRRAHGLTAQQLAERSGLSRRFLTDLEAGKGNISIGRLQELSRSLEVLPASLLLPERKGAESALVEVWTLLNGLSTAELDQVTDFVCQRFVRTRRRRKVALVGLRGAGKTTIGKHLADKLKVPFVELDRAIEQHCRMSLNDLFVLQGEATYRRLERDVLCRVLARNGASVIATGGGLVTNREAYELLRRQCVVFWLRARPEDHMHRVVAQGDQRPMRNNPSAMDDLRALLESREPLYALAHQQIDTSNLGVQGAVQAMLRQLAQ
ncbi:MAG: shikimate kinase [Planctomycetota bacterium]